MTGPQSKIQNPKSKILLTGFEPFGAHEVNPSALVAAALDGLELPRATVQAVRLPVHWQDAPAALDQVLATVQPRWVVLLGLASTATTIRVEMQAANVAGPIRDNAAQEPPTPILAAEGPPTHASTFPGPAIVACLAAAGLPVVLSTDAGQYLCNATLYHALAWATTQPAAPPVGFIHLPPLAEAAQPGLTLDDEIRAVRLALDVVVRDA